MSKKNMPKQAQENDMELSPKSSDFSKLCLTESILFFQIMPFMFLVPETEDVQHEVKGHCFYLFYSILQIFVIMQK